jgi:hypothetical protein
MEKRIPLRAHELAEMLLAQTDGPIEISVDYGDKDAGKRCYGVEHIETIKHDDGWILCFDGEIN